MKKYILTILIILLIYYLNKSRESFIGCKFNVEDKKIFDNKEFIIILGDKNWFNKKKVIFDSNILINLIKKIKRYNFKIYQNTKDFYSCLNKINKKKIKCIFIFQDILSNCKLNKINIKETIYYMKKLNDKYKISIYPKIEDIEFFASKKYYSLLKNNMNYSIFPDLEFIEIKDFSKNNFVSLINKIDFYSSKLFKRFDNIVIKKGYNSEKNIILSKDLLNCKKKLIEVLLYLDDNDLFDKKNIYSTCENNVDRIYILHGYITKKNRFNDYKIIFLNGEQKYISWGNHFTNLCVEDVQCNINNYSEKDKDIQFNDSIINNIINKLNSTDKEITNHILSFSKIVYKDFINIYFKGKHPLIFKLDISWNDNKVLQDKHSKYLKKSNKWIRLYINDIKIEDMHFMYNQFLCKDNKILKPINIQKSIYNFIKKYIKDNK